MDSQAWFRNTKIQSILGLIPHSPAFLSIEARLPSPWADFLGGLSDEHLDDALLILREERSMIQDIHEQTFLRKQKLKA
jgi:hypothetical protein